MKRGNCGPQDKSGRRLPALEDDLGVIQGSLNEHIRRYKTNLKPFSNYTLSYESGIRRHDRHCQEKKSRHHRSHLHHHSPRLSTPVQDCFMSGIKFLASVDERYKRLADYRCYRLIHESERHDDEVPFKIQKMRRKVAA